MSRERWIAEYDKLRLHFIRDLGLNPRAAWERARRLTERRFGRCPGEAKLPWKVRVALWWLRQKLEDVEPVEVSMLVKKIVVSLTYGVIAAGPVLNQALADNVVSGQEWGAILTAGVVAFWGAFKSNTTVIAPARTGETVANFGPR